MNKEYYGVRRVGDHEEAYIAHIGREKGWKMPNAKYIARLITSNGTYKYIYNQAQLAAAKGGRAMSRVRRTAQNAAGELRKRSGAFRQVDNALGMSRSGAQVKKARATRAKVYGTQNGLQKALKNAGSAVSKAAGRAGKALSDASGLTAKKELNKAARTSERVNKGISRSRRGEYDFYDPSDPLEKRRNSTKKRYQDKVVKARDKYNKTLLGRAESAGRSIGEIAEQVGNNARNRLKGVGNAAGKALDVGLWPASRKSIAKAASNARKATGKALRKTSVGKKIDNQLGISATAQNKKKNAAFKKKALSQSKDYSNTKGFSPSVTEAVRADARRRKLDNAVAKKTGRPLDTRSTTWHQEDLRADKAQRRVTSSKISKKGMKAGNRPSALFFNKNQGWQTNNVSEAVRLGAQGDRKERLKNQQTRSAQGTEGSRLGGSRKPLTYKSKKARLQSWRRKRGIR